MIPVLIRGKASIGEPAAMIDELYGIRFDEENFHFALAATLTKGLQASATKPAAIKTLTAFVEIGMTNAICPGSSPHHDIDIPLPPYLSMVMSRANNSSEIKQLLWMVGLPIEDSELGDRDMWSSIPAIEGMSDRNLLLSGILAMIDFKSCEEGIQRHALVFFTHMARRRPEVFIIL
jgi:neurofibromin 1